MTILSVHDDGLNCMFSSIKDIVKSLCTQFTSVRKISTEFIAQFWLFIISFFYSVSVYAGTVYTDCERPPTILHGRTELSVDDEGIVVTALYKCDAGYHLHGQSQLTCNTDTDEWMGDLPACKLGKPSIRILNSLRWA